MRKSENENNQIARIENTLVEKGHYKLSAIEQKILLYSIGKINPNQKDFHTIIIPLVDLQNLLKGSGKGRNYNYDRIRKVFKKLLTTEISFREIEFEGKIYTGGITFLQSYIPVNVNGKLCMEIIFAERLKPFLLNLQHYVQINLLEVAQMQSTHAIRLFQLLKSAHNQQKGHKKITNIKYQVKALKSLLGIADKYSLYRELNRRVINVAVKEINKNTSIRIIEVEKIRNNKRQIVELVFHCTDQKTKYPIPSITVSQVSKPLPIDSEIDQVDTPKKGNAQSLLELSSKPINSVKPKSKKVSKVPKREYQPNQSDINQLTRAQWNAYLFLVDNGVYEVIALKMVKGIKGIVAIGYEDYFIKYAWEIFISKTNEPKEAWTQVFVSWWNSDFFNDRSYWAQITEQINLAKKKLDQAVLDSRDMAKEMPRSEFEKRYKQLRTKNEEK